MKNGLLISTTITLTSTVLLASCVSPKINTKNPQFKIISQSHFINNNVDQKLVNKSNEVIFYQYLSK